MGLCVSDRRHPERLSEGPAEMAGGHPEISGEAVECQVEDAAFLDRVSSDRSQLGGPVDRGVARGFLRPASETGAKPVRLCRGRAREKRAILFPRRSGGTYGPAVDSGRRDPDEDFSVESGVPRDEGRVGNVVIVPHKLRIARFTRSFTRFSDMELSESPSIFQREEVQKRSRGLRRLSRPFVRIPEEDSVFRKPDRLFKIPAPVTLFLEIPFQYNQIHGSPWLPGSSRWDQVLLRL